MLQGGLRMLQRGLRMLQELFLICFDVVSTAGERWIASIPLPCDCYKPPSLTWELYGRLKARKYPFVMGFEPVSTPGKRGGT